MRDEKEERKKQARSYKQNAKQHSTPKAVTFPKKNELPRVGLEPTTLYTLDRALYQLSCLGSLAGWAQISHVIVHVSNKISYHVPPPPSNAKKQASTVLSYIMFPPPPPAMPKSKLVLVIEYIHVHVLLIVCLP